MADEPGTSAPAASIADQYEFGDEASTSPDVPEPAEQASTPPAPSTRDRNPDGTFKAAESPSSAGHPPSMVRMAREIGVPDDAINSLTTEQLGDWLHNVQRQVLQERAQNSQARVHEQARNPQPPLGAEPPKVDEFDLGEFKESLDPKFAAYLEGMEKRLKSVEPQLKKLETLEQYVQQLHVAEQSRQLTTYQQQCDLAFAKHEKTLGKGGRADIEQNSPEFAKRMAVLSLAERDDSPTSLHAKIDRAVKLLYGESEPPVRPEPEVARVPPAPPEPLAKRAQDWQRGGLARPTNRDGAKELNGVAKAERSVAAKLREMGSSSEESGSVGDGDFLE